MIPVPGVDASVFKEWMESNSNDAFNLLSMFSGGAFENFSICALGITPLITAQIVVQLLGGAFPSFAKIQRRGEHGRRITTRITNIVAVILALIQSSCMAIGFSRSDLISGSKILSIISITVCMTAGTGLMMWFAHILTEKSIGNGVSTLLMVNIISGMPAQFIELFKELTKNSETAIVSMAVAIIVILIVIIVVVYMSEGYYRLPVQYSQKMTQSEEDVESGYIPIKVNISGVLPVIFASSLMAIPQLVAAITGKGYGSGISKVILNMMSQKNWFDTENPIYSMGLFIYLTLIIFFAFFYLPMSFNAAEISDQIRKSGSFIPNIRAGEDTEMYIQNIARRLTSIGVVMLICVTVIPTVICGTFQINTSLSGTSIIIVVGVATELAQQIKMEIIGNKYNRILAFN